MIADHEYADQGDAATQFQAGVKIIDDGYENAHRPQRLDQTAEHFALIAQNGGIVEIEVIHANQEDARERENPQKALFVVEHQVRIARPQTDHGSRHKRERNQACF